MTPAMRYIVADILRGDRELQLKQGEKRRRKTKQVADVRTLEFQGFDTTEAVNKVAAWDKVNPRTIWRALKNDQGRFDARVKSLQGLQAKTRKPNPR